MLESPDSLKGNSASPILSRGLMTFSNFFLALCKFGQTLRSPFCDLIIFLALFLLLETAMLSRFVCNSFFGTMRQVKNIFKVFWYKLQLIAFKFHIEEAHPNKMGERSQRHTAISTLCKYFVARAVVLPNEVQSRSTHSVNGCFVYAIYHRCDLFTFCEQINARRRKEYILLLPLSPQVHQSHLSIPRRTDGT
jgi:hypothetical protein